MDNAHHGGDVGATIGRIPSLPATVRMSCMAAELCRTAPSLRLRATEARYVYCIKPEIFTTVSMRGFG